MGRIKTSMIKRIGKSLLEKYPDKFLTDFEKNKAIVTEVADIPSKKLRNVITGYVTKNAKKL